MMIFKSSRAYKDCKKQWVNTLPKSASESSVADQCSGRQRNVTKLEGRSLEDSSLDDGL